MIKSQYFSLDEFRCKDGTPVPKQYYLNLEILIDTQLNLLREYLNKPIIILSGYRSPAWNKKVGGKSKSLHLTASAADIVVPGMSTLELMKVINQLTDEGKMKPGGRGLYLRQKFIHIDIGSPRGWGGWQVHLIRKQGQ